MDIAENNLKDEEVLTVSLEKPAFFRVLVERYQEPFLRKALGILRHREEAEDVVQEAFIKIYFNGKKFKKKEDAEFKSWAYKILVNAAISRYRQLSKRKQMESNEPLDLELTAERNNLTENMALEKENKSVVNDLISHLPKPLGRLVSLYYIRDKSYKEITKQESMTIPALKMKLFRAKKLLKDQIKKEDGYKQ